MLKICLVLFVICIVEKKKEFNIISTGNYQVADKYSTTLKNEKRLIDDLTNDISDKIKKQINLLLNDL